VIKSERAINVLGAQVECWVCTEAFTTDLPRALVFSFQYQRSVPVGFCQKGCQERDILNENMQVVSR
jgi:hypothetical protein